MIAYIKDQFRFKKTDIPYLWILFGVLLCCVVLFGLDRETHSFYDLLTPGNLVALFIYFSPTFLLCLVCYEYIFVSRGIPKRLVLSLVTGIPLGFILVIFLLR